MSPDPYVSVVAVSRNDDHGGGMLRRMQIFVSAWLEQCHRHGLPAELVLVEWNPPPDREPLVEALRWSGRSGPCTVRVITVPAEIHHRHRHAEALPLFQMIGKNVGIRRARAPFVLATNVDILFNDEFVSYLAARRLGKGRFYRIDRSDAAAEVPLEGGVAGQLEYCRAHLLRVNEREATFAVSDGDGALASAVLGPSFALGDGLGVDRRPTGEPYLSAASDATLRVRPPSGGPSVIRMLVEAGPNLRREALIFSVRATGRTLARVAFRDQARVFVPVPGPPGEEITLQVGVERPGPSFSGPRSLHLRLYEWGWASPNELRFECDAGDGDIADARAVAAQDVYEWVQGVSLHRGFGDREFDADGRMFRRATGHARFSSYRPTRLPGELVLDVEAEVPVELRVTSTSGDVVAVRPLESGRRATIKVPEPESPGRAVYELHVIGRPAAGPEESLRVYGLRRVGLGQTLRRLFRPLTRPRVDFLHTNACGDFTLMHRDHWFRLRGYPEWEAYSMNIDGFACYAAHADGLQEVVLRDPMRIYHIEHGIGSGWSPEGERKLYQRITSRGITWIRKERVLKIARRMYQRGPLIANDEHWGLAREILAEAAPGRAAVTVDESGRSREKGV